MAVRSAPKKNYSMEPAAAEEGPRLVTDLPGDALALVLMRLGHGHGRARDIARTALAWPASSR